MNAEQGLERRIVLDASALLRWYLLDGEVSNDLDQLLERASRGELLILVPDLLFLEAASVLLKQVKQQSMSAREASDLLQEISRLPLRAVAAAELKAEAFALALTEGLSVYDAAYLALARREQARLVTVDAKLRNAAQHLGP